MKVENSKDVVEISYLHECQRLIEGRLKEILQPEGLRAKEFAGWPFKLAKLLVVITSPGHYAHEGEKAASYAKASTETREADQATEATQKDRQSNPSQTARPPKKTKR